MNEPELPINRQLLNQLHKKDFLCHKGLKTTMNNSYS